jgi:hypothetical protein
MEQTKLKIAGPRKPFKKLDSMSRNEAINYLKAHPNEPAFKASASLKRLGITRTDGSELGAKVVAQYRARIAKQEGAPAAAVNSVESSIADILHNSAIPWETKRRVIHDLTRSTQ